MTSPIKANFKTEILPIIIIVLSFIAGYYFSKHFPAQVATHWDINGKVNGYSSSFWAAWLLPLMILGMYIFFLFLPYLDPKKEQYLSFAPVYHKFKSLIIAFLFILYIFTGLNGIGYKVNIGFWSPIMIGLLFMIIGYLLKSVKMNWFLGIRTPWTMSSDYVWAKTHQASSPVLIAAGLVMALSAFLPASYKMIAFILAMALIIITLPIYSFILYKKEQKEKTPK